MQTAKTIFVTGATGNQGGAVVRNLLKKGFHVKALVRDPSSAAAKAISQMNVEIIKGDLDDPASYQHHLPVVEGVFCNLSYKQGSKKETRQGIDLATVAAEKKVRHFIYSSVIGCDLETGIPHWETKWAIEKHIKTTGIDYTILRPSSLYENFLIPQVKKGIFKGKLTLPTKKNTVQQFVGAEDVGRVSSIIFSDPGKYTGRTMVLAAEQMDGEQLAAIFSGVLEKKIKFQQLPRLIVRLFLGSKLAKMFRWIDENEAVLLKNNSNEQTKEFPGMLGLDEWIKINFQ